MFIVIKLVFSLSLLCGR